MFLIRWRRWEPSEDHELDSRGQHAAEAINSILGGQCSTNTLLKLWPHWESAFPGQCVLATMTLDGTPGHNRRTQQLLKLFGQYHDIQQLRFWFSEPKEKPDPYFVDSNGHGLIVDVYGRKDVLKECVKKMLPKEQFKEGLEHGVATWRKV